MPVPQLVPGCPFKTQSNHRARALCNVTQAVPLSTIRDTSPYFTRPSTLYGASSPSVPSNVKTEMCGGVHVGLFAEICDAVMGYALVGKWVLLAVSHPAHAMMKSTRVRRFCGRFARRAFAHEIDSSQNACVGGLRKVLHTVSRLGSHSVEVNVAMPMRYPGATVN